MKRYFFVLFFSLTVLWGCSTPGTGSVGGEYDTIYQPKYASHFLVLKNSDTTILRVLNPWQGAKDVSYDYAFSGDTPQRIITMSTSHSAFFDALGLEDKVVGVSCPAYLSNEHHRELPDIGYGTSLNYETIVGLKSDLFTTYEVSGENSSATIKLESLRVPIVYIADYLEDSPLAKAEWIIAFGAMVGESQKAAEIFSKVEDNYNSTKQAVAEYTKNITPQKVILNSPYKDVWYMPGDSSYIVQLIRDAGAICVAEGVPDNISRPVSMESAFVMFKKADLWLNPAANIQSVEALEGVNALLGDIQIPVYTNAVDANGGSDFWESGVLRCDVVLKDLVKIFYADAPVEHSLYYHKKLE